MKLISKVTLFYLVITLIVMGAGGFLTFNIFKREVQLETELFLIERVDLLKEKINAGESLGLLNDSKTYIRETSQKVPGENEKKYFFSDTVVMHPYLQRLEDYNKITTVFEANNKTYYVEMHELIIESDDILDSVIKSQTRLFIILGFFMVLSSFLISKWLFKPFEITLEKITRFNIKQLKAIPFNKTNIKEFNILNNFIHKMTEKVSLDYRNLKEFAENASHELQTPIAIAKGKLELLMQSENLSEEQMQLINSAQESITHISRLNHSLTLLSKIENREFGDIQEIDVCESLKMVINNFKEIADLKGIRIDMDIPEHEILTKNDPSLIRILFNNLIQNAIRHNVKNGQINIILHSKELVIRNTGEDPNMETEILFERFKKSRQSGKTTGLGLAIVKRICEASNYAIEYKYDAGWHTLVLRLDNAL